MQKQVEKHILALEKMKKYPEQLFYVGNEELLYATKVSVIGSRKTSKYARELTRKLASALSRVGVCVVSGGAMGVDAMAHLGAGSTSTIAVLPCGTDIKYPAVNKNLLSDIEKHGLLLSQFKSGFRATPWSFVVRNELVVALGDVLVVAEAELGSGSMRSIEYALKMHKEIFVFPHRLGESSATQELLQNNQAKVIYDIEKFVARFAQSDVKELKRSPFIEFCASNPSYEEALSQFGEDVFNAELNGEIEIKNARIYLK